MNKLVSFVVITTLFGCDPDSVQSVKDAGFNDDAIVNDAGFDDVKFVSEDASLERIDAFIVPDVFIRDAPSNSGLIWRYIGTFRWEVWVGSCQGMATRPADCVSTMIGQTILIAPNAELRPINVFNEPIIQGSSISFNFSQNHAEITGGIRCSNSQYQEVELQVWECME